MLSFRYGFVLTDQHIEQLASLGSVVCRSLTYFGFLRTDVSYDAHNKNELTDNGTTQLARMCPSLSIVKLEGVSVSRVTDATLVAFLSNCPNLTSIEITGASGAIKETSFDALREHPDWVPKLRTLRIPECGRTLSKDRDRWMKAMRALSRERETLLIEVVREWEIKKWGDWELESFTTQYRKGRVQRGW